MATCKITRTYPSLLSRRGLRERTHSHIRQRNQGGDIRHGTRFVQRIGNVRNGIRSKRMDGIERSKMNCPNCKAYNALNEPECHTGCGFSFIRQEYTHPPKIVVTKSGLTVNDEPFLVKNRWSAKRVAEYLANHYSTHWFNLKSNGKLAEVKSI